MNSEDQLRLAIVEALQARGVTVTSLGVTINDDFVVVTGNVTSFHALQILQRQVKSLVQQRRLVVDVVVSNGEVTMECVATPRGELNDLRGRMLQIMLALEELQASLEHADIEQSQQIVKKLLRRADDTEPQALRRAVSSSNHKPSDRAHLDRKRAMAASWLEQTSRLRSNRRLPQRLELEA